MEDAQKKDDANLPTIIYRGAKVIPLIIGNETFERLGSLGSSANLLVYFTTFFNMDSITATTIVNLLNGSTNLATLPGAFLTDTFFGRFKILSVASIASFLGMFMLTLTAAVPGLHPPHCIEEHSTSCVGPTQWQYLFLLVTLALLVIGGGGVRPCNLAFGIDQFDPHDESSRRGIVSFFNWYYLSFTTALMIAVTVIVYVQSNVSWALGLGIPAGLMFLSCVLFFSGTKLYVKVKPVGSPYVTVVQVFVAAIKKRRLDLSQGVKFSVFDDVPGKSIFPKLPYTNQFRFLEKAAIIAKEDELNEDGVPANQWELCSMQQVEQVKCLIRILPVWISGIIYFVFVVSLMQIYVVFQAQQIDRRVGGSKLEVPSASFIAVSMMAVSIFLPIYDRIVVPTLRRITKNDGGITVLQRIGFGMIISIPTLILSGVIEEKRRTSALESGHFVSPMSWMWLVPQMAIAGLSDAFAIVGLFEFYYKQVPDNMKSLGGSFFFCGMAMSSYLTSFIISLVHKATTGSVSGNWLPDDLNQGRLDYYYYAIAGLQMVNLVYFFACSRWYMYKGTDGQDIDGKLGETLMI
ncbi:hypothetical protein Droror1_Dr00012293 [Drosera rotundifolia]